MPDQDYLRSRFPILSSRLPRTRLASLPTPLAEHSTRFDGADRSLLIKYDNRTGSRYGGNKVRKLEYIFPRARMRHCVRIATFGAVGSNHALATALYATSSGFECTCFLSHQAKTPLVPATLNKHIRNGTELVRYGGDYAARLRILREHLWGRHAWVVPLGGSSWLGTIGFVAAGLELADQLATKKRPAPDRLYVATGTMGTAVGIALGLALAGLDTEVQAVRVSDTSIMNREALGRLLAKTAMMMRRYDATVPDDLADLVKIRIRDEFFGPGYAKGTPATDEAIGFATDAIGLELETTYTAKAMAALLADWRSGDAFSALYWHTYNSAALDVPADRPLDSAALPEAFLRYFE
jgi:D-cysteine desulfhydrase